MPTNRAGAHLRSQPAPSPEQQTQTAAAHDQTTTFRAATPSQPSGFPCLPTDRIAAVTKAPSGKHGINENPPDTSQLALPEEQHPE